VNRSQTYESLLKNLSKLFSTPMDFSLATQKLQKLLEGRGAREPDGPAQSDRWDLIAGVIDQQIIPKLAKAHEYCSLDGHGQQPQPWLGPEHIRRFSDLLVNGDSAAAGQYVQDLAEAGFTRTSLLMDLVGPAARELGVRWTEDCCSFADVSLGLVRIHEIVHAIGGTDDDQLAPSANPGKILLSCMPGSRHILGCSIVAEFFRECAWDARVMLPNDADELTGVVRSEGFDVVGLSVSIDSQLKRIKPLISALRAQSNNRQLAVFLGGPVFMLREHHAAEFDADAICIDPRMTVTLAEISRLTPH
jgi:methanogenic corrinoid protein MtbC1